MRGKEYSPEIREEAEDLYVEEGLGYEEVSKRTGIPLHTIKRWGGDDGWKNLRRESLKIQRELKKNMRKLRTNLMTRAVANPDPQDIYALIRLENLALQRERKPEKMAADIDRPRLFLEDMEFIAQTLQEIDPGGLKILARNFETIVKRFKDRNEKAT
jgi:transposase-like protein